MTHPIPAPRNPADHRPNFSTPSRASGPACASCAHRTCRTHRAQTLPRLGGHRAEFAHEHDQAARIQAHHPGVVVWFGEATQSFWVATSTGMMEAETLDHLLALLWIRRGRFARAA
ncbi:hypothetical protein ACFYOC_02215 [Nocardiopsis alba]|uniref:hypothetical protein n=1 Tax=Nocardiopsis alba TaxID=53437 RepID=UPI00366A9F90